MTNLENIISRSRYVQISREKIPSTGTYMYVIDANCWVQEHSWYTINLRGRGKNVEKAAQMVQELMAAHNTRTIEEA